MRIQCAGMALAMTRIGACRQVRVQLGGVARLAKVADVVDEVEVGDLVLQRLAQLGRARIVVAVVATRRLARPL